MRLRKLALAVGLASTFSAQLVGALGMGEIKLHSNLNQPLQAEIKLLQARDLTEDEILITLASKEEFQRAGVDRPYFLTDLNFKVDLNGPSGPVIRITSRKPVREPYLNFLLESQWPSGRILREYTLLLDLPLFSDEVSKPVQSARASSAKAQPGAAAQPMRSGNSKASSRADGDVYGPVSASDTLWEIALQIRPGKQYSVHKTMLAIQRLNPEAFINGNINLLRRGQVLRIPQASDIDTFSQEQALNEVAFQNSQWSGDESGSALGPRLDASSSDGQASSQPKAVEGRLKVAGGELTDGSQSGRGSGNLGGSSGSTQDELSVSLEELDKTRRENSDLKGRVAELEAQIKTMERLVEVSNQEMRALQLQASGDAAAKALIDPAAAEPSAAMESKPTEMDAEATTVTAAEPEKSSLEQAKPKPVDASKVVRSAKPKEQSWLEILTDNILYIGGLIVAILAAILLLMRRRDDQEEGELDLASAPITEEQVYEEPIETEQEALDHLAEIAEEEELLTDEVAVDDFTAGEDASVKTVSTESQTGDAVGEADIYIAYGKMDQAEEMLLKAIETDGSDIAARLKLMEVYAEINNLEKFEEQYAAIAATGDEVSLARADDLRLDFEDLPQSESVSTKAIFDTSEAEADDSLELSLDDDLLEGFDSFENEGTDELELVAEDDLSSENQVSEEASLDIVLDEQADSGSGDDFDLELDLDLEDLDIDDSDIAAEFEDDEDLDLNLDDDQDVGLGLDLDDEQDTGLDLDLDDEQDIGLDLDLDLGSESDEADFESEFDESEFELDEALLDDEVALEFTGEDGEAPSFDMDMDSLESGEPVVELESISDLAADLDEEFDLESDDVDLAALDEELDALSDDETESAEELADQLSSELDSLIAEEDVAEESESLAQELEEEFDLAADLGIDEKDLTADSDTGSSDDEIFTAALADLPSPEDVLAADEVTDEDMDAEFDFLADSDEIATKLDLARAYIDMGDQDGAKDILDEVLQEGDEQQRQDAEELISRLS